MAANPDMPQDRRDYLLHHALPAGDALRLCLEATAGGEGWIADAAPPADFVLKTPRGGDDGEEYEDDDARTAALEDARTAALDEFAATVGLGEEAADALQAAAPALREAAAARFAAALADEKAVLDAKRREEEVVVPVCPGYPLAVPDLSKLPPAA